MSVNVNLPPVMRNGEPPRSRHDELWERTRSRQSTAEWATDDPNGEPTTTDAWHTCANAVKKYDETLVRNWKEEIDTLLVFAGLFSAVIISFIIESYQWLQPDSSQTIIQLLADISAKLDNSPTTVASPTEFRAPVSAVIINTLWFSSLVAALASAFMGILVKQWLREYMRPASTSPKESVTLRQSRYQGLKSWGVIEIISLLPLILEFALVLFLAGLLELLWTLHHTVAAIISVELALLLIFYIATTILPALPDSNCPYKSPQSWVFCSIVWRMMPSKFSVSRRSWQEREMIPLLQGLMKRRTMEALLWIDKVFWDLEVLDSIGSCLVDMRSGYSDAAVQFVHRVMAYRAGCTVEALKENVLKNNVSPKELEASGAHPLVSFRLRIDRTRAQRLRKTLMESLVWQWSISSELIHTTPVLTKIHDILATMRTFPEHQDCFEANDGLPRKIIEIVSDVLGRDPSVNPLFSALQTQALDVLAYFSYRTPPPTLQDALPCIISAVRKSYANVPIFLATGSILTRVLGRWDITSFQTPQTHLEFIALLSDMQRYFDGCNAERVQYGDRRVGKWPRRMRVVISRFLLSEEDKQVLAGVLEALQKGEELGLIPK